MYDLSIIVSGIRVEKWEYLLQQLRESCGDLKYEVIFSGPFVPEGFNLTRHEFVRDFGTPSRAFMKAAVLANGKYICQCPDDAILLPLGIKKCHEAIQNDRKKICIVRYNEGANYGGSEFPLAYWNIKFHPRLNACVAVKPEWDAGPWFMMDREYFVEMGGVDCRFEHLNLNVNDLIYRVYRDGGSTVMSPTVVAKLNWENTGEEVPLVQAFLKNDLPLLEKLYASNEQLETNPIKIDINNWKASEKFWHRKWKNE